MKKILLVLTILIAIGALIYIIMRNNWALTSQAVIESTANTEATSTPEKPTLTPADVVTSAEERANIELRIKKIEAEILQSTNDPERDIELRTELQSLKSKL